MGDTFNKIILKLGIGNGNENHPHPQTIWITKLVHDPQWVFMFFEKPTCYEILIIIESTRNLHWIFCSFFNLKS